MIIQIHHHYRYVQIFARTLGAVGFAVLASCSDARIGQEQLGSTEQAWVDPGPNQSVTNANAAWDPSVAYVRSPDGRPGSRGVELGRYVTAYNLLPKTTNYSKYQDAIGWSWAVDMGGAQYNWKPVVGTDLQPLPIARPSTFDFRTSTCPDKSDPTTDDNCKWGSYGSPGLNPVALPGPQPGTFVLVAGIGTLASRSSTDVALVLSTDGGQTFSAQALNVSIPITSASSNIDGEGPTGLTGGKITYLDAYTPDYGQSIWIYWQTASSPYGFMRLLHWNGTKYRADTQFPEPFAAPGPKELGDARNIQNPKLLIDRTGSAQIRDGVDDYRIILVGAVFPHVYSDLTSTPWTVAPRNGLPVDDETPCDATLQVVAAAPSYVVINGDRTGAHFWKGHAQFAIAGENAPVPLCIGDGRRAIAAVAGYKAPNPFARLHFRPSAVIEPAPSGEDVTTTAIEVAYVLADPPVIPGEPGATFFNVVQLGIDSSGKPGTTGNLDTTQFHYLSQSWTDPSRPKPGSLQYNSALYDQWNPTLATLPTGDPPGYQGQYTTMLTWQDSKQGTTKSYDSLSGVKLWRYISTRGASRMSWGDWQLGDGPASAGIDDVSTQPPTAVPWALTSPLGHVLGLTATPRTGHFLAVWPDDRHHEGNICNPFVPFVMMSAEATAG